jgi:uncharacterized membrane protein YhaH (DUF805 family)
MGELFQPTHLLVIGVLFMFFPLLIVPPFWMICKKAGFSPWLSLLVIVPWVNLVALYFLAFSNWRTASGAGQNGTTTPAYPTPFPPQVG